MTARDELAALMDAVDFNYDPGSGDFASNEEYADAILAKYPHLTQPTVTAEQVESDWADWFESQSSHLGGKPVFSGDEVAALLRGHRPFGIAAGIEVAS